MGLILRLLNFLFNHFCVQYKTSASPQLLQSILKPLPLFGMLEEHLTKESEAQA